MRKKRVDAEEKRFSSLQLSHNEQKKYFFCYSGHLEVKINEQFFTVRIFLWLVRWTFTLIAWINFRVSVIDVSEQQTTFFELSQTKTTVMHLSHVFLTFFLYNIHLVILHCAARYLLSLFHKKNFSLTKFYGLYCHITLHYYCLNK